jgi:hypothetical protein
MPSQQCFAFKSFLWPSIVLAQRVVTGPRISPDEYPRKPMTAVNAMSIDSSQRCIASRLPEDMPRSPYNRTRPTQVGCHVRRLLRIVTPVIFSYSASRPSESFANFCHRAGIPELTVSVSCTGSTVHVPTRHRRRSKLPYTGDCCRSNICIGSRCALDSGIDTDVCNLHVRSSQKGGGGCISPRATVQSGTGEIVVGMDLLAVDCMYRPRSLA